jgi:hypothetical protein
MKKTRTLQITATMVAVTTLISGVAACNNIKTTQTEWTGETIIETDASGETVKIAVLETDAATGEPVETSVIETTAETNDFVSGLFGSGEKTDETQPVGQTSGSGTTSGTSGTTSGATTVGTSGTTKPTTGATGTSATTTTQQTTQPTNGNPTGTTGTTQTQAQPTETTQQTTQPTSGTTQTTQPTATPKPTETTQQTTQPTQPTNTPVPTATSTPVPTATSTPTPTPEPTATPTPVPTLEYTIETYVIQVNWYDTAPGNPPAISVSYTYNSATGASGQSDAKANAKSQANDYLASQGWDVSTQGYPYSTGSYCSGVEYHYSDGSVTYD